MSKQEVEIQRQYYENTAHLYDEMHLAKDQEHILALHLLAGYIEFYQIRSVLDIGAGTGRTVQWLQTRYPGLVVKGIDSSSAPPARIPEGHITERFARRRHLRSRFADNSFDLVCEFAVLHHLREPDRAIREMSRVAKKMLCISDCNFMGQGSLPARLIKLIIFALGLWPVANWIKTKSKGYTISNGDGLAYSYSVFQSFATLQQFWSTLRTTSTEGDTDRRCGQIITAGQLLVVGLEKTGSHQIENQLCDNMCVLLEAVEIITMFQWRLQNAVCWIG